MRHLDRRRRTSNPHKCVTRPEGALAAGVEMPPHSFSLSEPAHTSVTVKTPAFAFALPASFNLQPVSTQSLTKIFPKFPSKIACQAPKSSNIHQPNNLAVAL